jgi:hypothetical protein
MTNPTMIQASVATTTLPANTSGSHLRSRHGANVGSCNNDVLGATFGELADPMESVQNCTLGL